MYVLVFLLVGWLVLVPTGYTLVLSFLDRPLYEAGARFALDAYEVFLRPGTLELVRNTLGFTAYGVVTGFVLAVPMAWLVEATDLRGRQLWRAGIYATLAIGPGVAAVAWTMLLDERIGALNLLIRGAIGSDATAGPLDVYTLPVMGFVSGTVSVSTIFTFVSPSIRRIAGDFYEASYACGAGPVRTATRIVMPLIRPGLLSALFVMAVIILASFEIPAIIGGRGGLVVFANRIYFDIHPPFGLPNYNNVAAFAVSALVVSLALISLYFLLHQRAERYAVVLGRGYRQTPFRLGRLGQVLGQAFMVVVFLGAFGTSLLILLWMSLQPFPRPPSVDGLSTITLDAYVTALTSPDMVDVYGNTLLVVVVTASATMLLGTLTSWLVVRTRLRGRALLNALSFLPVGLPAILIATAIFLAYLFIPVPISGTVWILVLAMSTSFLGYASSVMKGATLQLHPDLEDASLASGSTSLSTFRRVTFPLLLPAFVAGWTWVAAHAVRDMTISSTLLSQDNTVVGSRIWELWNQGNLQQVSALGVVTAAVIFVLVLVWQGSERAAAGGGRRVRASTRNRPAATATERDAALTLSEDGGELASDH